jgi:hypothetical protein
MLFPLAHFCILHPTAIAHLTCVFLLLVNDTHIVGLVSNMVPIFLQLQEEFGALGLSVQLMKCLVWSPHMSN